MQDQYILRIDCPDEKGLVHKITGVLYHNDLNIIRTDEFVDKESAYFFMRIEFAGNTDENKIISGLIGILPSNSNISLNKAHKKNIIILATKEHHCLGDLLIRYHFNELNANILAVVSNHEVLHSLTEKFNIPFHFVPHENKSREEHESEVLHIVNAYRPDFLVLAKYMRVLTADFASYFPNKIVNIHHSFLPAFIGANPYRQAYQRGVKIIGATAHFVNENLDEGPIIAQSVIPVDHTENATDMARLGRDVEKIVLAKALKLVFEDRVFVKDNKTVIFE
ncbi:MAG: formyltetrahydrofolate deformylase [Thermoflexibacter sp.]|uniref:Formyltetrahydrofolate deformylase n=1 Tax=Thermoflexibacter ruber TaxID=1003 RepID=A0A1I2I6K6_9BACT|nr:formyltetrahydrofolate deformylase [Thermoflexibacter ruber]SFF36121.1 formyltetrahydrofolate deformylase [Thermoflexibacter ruber]